MEYFNNHLKIRNVISTLEQETSAAYSCSKLIMSGRCFLGRVSHFMFPTATTVTTKHTNIIKKKIHTGEVGSNEEI